MPSSLEPKANELARAMLRELWKTRSQTELEGFLGISQGRISRLVSNDPNEGTSARVLMRAATLLGREQEALAVLTNDEIIGVNFLGDDEEEDRYPNRAVAIRYARDLGYSDEAIADVKKAALEEKEDP